MRPNKTKARLQRQHDKKYGLSKTQRFEEEVKREHARLEQEFNSTDSLAAKAHNSGDYQTSILLTLEVIEISKKIDALLSENKTMGISRETSEDNSAYWRIGKAYLMLNDEPNAIKYLDIVAQMTTDKPNLFTARALIDLITIHHNKSARGSYLEENLDRGNKAFEYVLMLEQKALLSLIKPEQKPGIYRLLARLYRYGLAKQKKNFELCERYYQEVLDIKNSPFYAEYLSIYNSNEFPKQKNPEKYVALLWQGATENNEFCAFHLGTLYSEGTHGFSQDLNKAFEYFEKAITVNPKYSPPEALHNYGYMLVHGEGTETDPEKGFIYLQRAAERGSLKAPIDLANCYSNGWGTPIDYKQAKKIYKQLWLTEPNNAMHAYNLGHIYIRLQKYVKAKKFLQKAANLNDALANHSLAKLLSLGLGCKIDLNLAIAHLHKSLGLGFSIAGEELLRIYLNRLCENITNNEEYKKLDQELDVIIEKTVTALNDDSKNKKFFRAYSIPWVIKLPTAEIIQRSKEAFHQLGENREHDLLKIIDAIFGDYKYNPKTKINHLLLLLSEPMNRETICFFVENITYLFKRIEPQYNNIRRYLDEVPTLFTKIADCSIQISVADATHILYLLSKIGVNPNEIELKFCIDLLNQKISQEKELTSDNLTEWLWAIAHLNLDLDNEELGKLKQKIFTNAIQCTQTEIVITLHALSIIHANHNIKDISKQVNILYQQINASEVANMSYAQQHQLRMATHYFKKNLSTLSQEINDLTPLQNKEVLANTVTRSKLQIRVAAALEANRVKFEEEVVLEDLLPVDFVLADGRILQVDGPIHFFHSKTEPPRYTPKNLLNEKIIGKTIIRIPYYELDPLKTKKELQEYLKKKLAPSTKIASMVGLSLSKVTQGTTTAQKSDDEDKTNSSAQTRLMVGSSNQQS